MLVHKRTLGAISYIWNKDGTELISATFKTYPEATPDEWWEVKNNSKLAKYINMVYPSFTPITDDNDNLVGVEMMDKRQINEAKRKELKRDQIMISIERGYTRYINIGSREKLFAFLEPDLIDVANKKVNINGQTENLGTSICNN